MSGRENGINIEQFLDDFYAESDEHLTSVRRNLLSLEEEVGKAAVDPKLLNGLFRSFHTLKGLSGMVGLDPAQDLAHALENALKLLRQGETSLTGQGVATLMEGVNRLEQIIAAKKTGNPFPEIGSVKDKIGQCFRIPGVGAVPPLRERERHEATALPLDEEKKNAPSSGPGKGKEDLAF